MLILGLTGSIGMGKSETARMFESLNIDVFDADKIVHELYAKGGAAVELVAKAFPAALTDNMIDREKLAICVLGNDDAIKRLEKIVHPLVHNREKEFLHKAEKKGARFVVLDIPLLFESGNLKRADKILVVSAPEDVQKKRVLERLNMNEKKFHDILARQVPDAEKRAKADFIIDTSKGLDDALRQVKAIKRQLETEI